MIVHVPLLVFLLANVYPSDAAIFSRSSESLTHVVRHARRNVMKRSSSLWEDMRLAYEGLRLQQKPQVLLQQAKMYCTNVGSGLTGIGSGNGPGDGSGDDGSDGSSGSSTSSEPVAAPSSQSVTFSVTTTAPGPSSTGSSGNGTSSGSSSPSSPWKVAESFAGNSFFDGWNWINSPDIWTHGVSQYVDEQTARSTNLIEINDAGHAITRVDTTSQISGFRPAVRLESKFTYSGGLVIFDAVHAPTGCGTWPAFWSNGPNWPQGGEIDIAEGVNEYTSNQVTLHTTPGCTMPSTDPNALGITGSVTASADCETEATGNAGCGWRDTRSNSWGAPFNSNGGGVYTMLWDDSGIQSWFFPRGSVPDDIENGKPQPSNWGKPVAAFPSSTCNPSNFFRDHVVILNTALCGDWAGGVWSVGGVAGQGQSCAQITGAATCEDYVRNNGGAFNEAYWEIKSIKIYQKS